MERKGVKVIKTLLLALMPMSISAQIPDTVSARYKWNLQDCIDYAITNNLEIKQKRLSVTQSKIDIEARQGALFPSLSFATNQNLSWRPWSDSYVNITDGSMATTSSTVNYNGSYGFQAQWTVWNGGINRRQLARSRVSLEQTETDVEIQQLSVSEQIVELYIQILYQTDAVSVCEQILESTRTQLKQAQGFYDVGKMSRADLTQVEAQVSQAEYNVTSATTQLSQFKMQLRQLLELSPDIDFSIVVPTVDDAEVMAILPTVTDVYDAAIAWRPELRYSRLGIDLADMDIDIAERGYYPTISLSAGINTSASSGLDTGWARQLKTNLSNSLGFTVSLPILDNRQNRTNVARAKVSKENAEIDLARQMRQIHDEIEGYWLSGVNAQQQFAAARTNVKSMEECYNLVSEQFAVGLKDIVDLTTAKSNLIQAQQQLLQTKYTAVLNRMMLNYYKGQTLAF